MIFLLLLINIFYISNQTACPKGFYPYSLYLKNGNVFLANANGMYTCSPNLTIQYNNKPYENSFSDFGDISKK